MGGSVESGNGVLGHEKTANGDIGWGGADAPSWVAGAVVEGCEDFFGGAVGWCFRKDGNGEARDAD